MPKAAKRNTTRKPAKRPRGKLNDGIFLRLREAIDILQNKHVMPGWHEAFDQARASRVLHCVAELASGKRRATVATDQEFVTFCRDHGISLDYIYRGDITGLLACAATHSPQAGKLSSAPDLKAARHVLFEQEEVVCEAFNYLIAIRSMATSDEMPREEGGALATVSQAAIERLERLKGEREWLLSMLNGKSDVPDGFERIEQDGKVWLKAA